MPEREDLSTETAGGHVRSLWDALQSAKITEADRAIVHLALHYARLADSAYGLGAAGAAIMIKLGPPYLATLTALGLSPASRAAIARGGVAYPQAPETTSPRDDLKARRARRKEA